MGVEGGAVVADVEVGDDEVTDDGCEADGLLEGPPPLDDVQPATAAKATSMLSPTASVLRVIDTPTTGLQGSEAGDPESQFAHFAL